MTTKNETEQNKSVEILKDLAEEVGYLSGKERDYLKVASEAIRLGYKHPNERLNIVEYMSSFLSSNKPSDPQIRDLILEFASYDHYSEDDLMRDNSWNSLKNSVKETELILNSNLNLRAK